MSRSGHLVVSVYPPVASKVKLEVENNGEWSPMEREAELAQETMIVVPYRVSNISLKEAYKIDDRITVVCKLVDWRDNKCQIRSLDHHDPAAFRAADIDTLTGGNDRNLAVACFAVSDSTGDQAAAVVDIPAYFTIPKHDHTPVLPSD